MGQTSGMEDWSGLLSERFLQQGAYFVPAGEYDWSGERVQVYTPELEISDAPDAWHPDDALMVPMRSGDGALLGIVSVDEPVTGRRPSPIELELLSTVVAHAAVAVEQAQTAELGRRHRAAVEHLLARVGQADRAPDGGGGARRGLLGRCARRSASTRWSPSSPRRASSCRCRASASRPSAPRSSRSCRSRRSSSCSTPRTCATAASSWSATWRSSARPSFGGVYSSVSNGRGPLAWNHHWVVVPLHDSAGRLDGMMWVDDPKDRLLPSDEALQALRVFANQAMGAIESARRLESLEHLAAHDPLTGLRNRRGFELAIERHLADAGAGGDLSLLVIDLDHFKRVNDSLGHDAGDDVLRRFADGAARRRPARPTCRRGSAARSSRSCCRAPARRPRCAVAERICGARARASSTASPAPCRCRSAWPGRGPEARDARRAHARRQPRALRRQAARARPLRRAPRADAGDARRAARRRGRRRAEQLAAAMLLAETLDLRDVATARHSRDRRPLRRADRARARLRGGRDRARARRRHPPRHRQARHRRRDPAQARRARRRTSGPRSKRHPELGSRILEHANLRDIAAWVLHHHERVDGAGYPRGAGRRGDPARGAHPRGRRRLRGDDLRPPVPRARCRSRPRARSCAAAPGASSTREVVAAIERVLDRSQAGFVATLEERAPAARRGGRVSVS